MLYLLDTDVAIHLIDHDDEDVISKIGGLTGTLQLSILTRVEVEGDLAEETGGPRRKRFEFLLQQAQVLPFTAQDAAAYADIVQKAGFSRRRALGRMIAAQALVHDATLVTRNGDDFRDIPGLRLLDV